jgi:hypothetical protein
VWQCASTTPIHTSREEEQKGGRVAGVMPRTRGEREPEIKSIPRLETRTIIQEVYIVEQSWNGMEMM